MINTDKAARYRAAQQKYGDTLRVVETLVDERLSVSQQNLPAAPLTENGTSERLIGNLHMQSKPANV